MARPQSQELGYDRSWVEVGMVNANAFPHAATIGRPSIDAVA